MSTRSRSRYFRPLFFLVLLALTPATRAADRALVREVGENFICICNCRQILSDCNHLGCPSSGPMLQEVEALLDAGKSEDEIIAAFAEKYGYTVLSSPPASGFNLLAYLLPLGALVIGIAIAVYVARTWKSAAPAPEGPPVETTGEAGFSRVEEELKKFTPED